MNTTHTPAPWKYDSTWGLIKYGKTEICALHSGNLANAHLISGAPDLLSALKQIADWEPSAAPSEPKGFSIIEVIDIARAAIAKAEGAK